LIAGTWGYGNDSLGGRQAAAPVADDRPHGVGFRGAVEDLPPALPGAAIADGNSPVIEQVAAHRQLVVAVVILLLVVSLSCPVRDYAELRIKPRRRLSNDYPYLFLSCGVTGGLLDVAKQLLSVGPEVDLGIDMPAEVTLVRDPARCLGAVPGARKNRLNGRKSPQETGRHSPTIPYEHGGSASSSR
jgi:hypothetical protein